jgi:uncharacterized protein (UPF0264 family)
LLTLSAYFFVAKHLSFRDLSIVTGSKMVKLLISPADEQEAIEAIQGGADIVDVKNPEEGSLGANFPWTITRIKSLLPQSLELSCTLGDIPNLPGTASLAAYGAASLGVNYVKGSLYNIRKEEDALKMMKSIAKAARERNPRIRIVVAGFADAFRIRSLEPMIIPRISAEAQCDVAMLDTAIKDRKNLFDFLTIKQIREFIDQSHKFNLKVALAGSLRKNDLTLLSSEDVDIIGVRGAACINEDRLKGRISREKVIELKKTIQVFRNDFLIT